jgi:hypothetical protein
MFKRVKFLLKLFFTTLVLLLVSTWILLHFSPVQTWVVQKVSQRLSEQLKTEISVKKVDFSVFKKIILEGVLIRDQHKDTLLYAGRLSASFNDWFVFKDKTIFDDIRIEHTNVIIHRKDSTWNYQFILDAFASKGTDKKTNLPNIRLNKILINNIRITQRDEWIGEDMHLSIGRLKINAEQIELNKQIIRIKDIDIKYPEYTIVNYKGNRPPKKSIKQIVKKDIAASPFLAGWIFQIGQIRINSGKFMDYTKNYKPVDYFDPEYISFEEINGIIDNLSIQGDSIISKIKLQTKERSGLNVKNLQSNIIFHVKGMEFHQLLLETPNSKLTGHFSMKYDSFFEDFNLFNHRVRLESFFKKSYLSTKDIAFFAPELKKINEILKINGQINGTIDNLSGKQLYLETSSNSRFAGNLIIKGLPDMRKVQYDIDAYIIETNAKSLSEYIPEIKSIKNPDLGYLGQIQYKGKASGGAEYLNFDGSVGSSVGTIATKLNLHIPRGGTPLYSGKINTSNLHLGQLFNSTSLGKISTEIEFIGKGFDTKNLKLDLKNKISSIEILGYTYKNIEFKGIANDHLMDGYIKIDDKNLSINLYAKVSRLLDNVMDVKIKGTVPKVCFKELGIVDRELLFKGNIETDFKIKSIDDFTGYFFIDNISLLEGEKQLPLKKINAKSFIDDNGLKNLEIHSDFIDASLKGIFTFKKMNNVVNKLLATYFPSYFKARYTESDYQVFDFNISTHEIEPFLSFFNLPFEGGNNSLLSGTINTDENIYELNSTIPHLKINNININDLNIKSNNNIAKMNVHGDVGLVTINDNLKIPNSVVDIIASNDTGSVYIKSKFSQTIDNTNLQTRFEITPDGIGLEFLKSDFVIEEKVWNIENNSKFFIGKNNLFSEGFTLSSGNETIKIFTHPSDLGAHNDITVEIRKLELGEVLPYAFTDPRIEGTSTGRIDILDPLGNLEVEAKISTEKLRINNDSIGLVPIESKYSNKKKQISYLVQSDNLNHIFNIRGSVNFYKTDSIYTNNIIELNDENLKILEPYVEGIISDLKGTGTGILQVSGPTEDLQLTGSVRLNNASLIIDYTKCRYGVLPGASITFSQNRINFGNILLKDTIGRIALFSGKINHSFFNDISFDLSFEALNKNKGILVLNTTKKDNSSFYGNIVAYTVGEIRGSANNISIKLKGQPTDSSRIYLPTGDSKVTGTASFIVFRQYGKDMRASTKLKESSIVTVDLDLIANPLAKVYLILDEVTNDIIEGQGNGAINLRIGTNENTSITGNFEITKGKYNFNWQSLFKKPFLINKGSINWTGDPYDARINIDANYVVEQVKLPDEIASGCSNDRNNILVVANLSNTLKSPIIKFRFELPQGHPCRNNPLTTNSLAQLYNNPDELNRQVISLLLMGSFITNGPNQMTVGSGLGNTFFSSAAGTISEFIAQQVTSGLDAVLRNVPGLKNLRLDPYVTFTPGLITSTQAEGLGFQGTGSFGFTRRLLNGRMLVKAGGSVLVAAGQSATVQNNRQLTPDLSIEWLITPDGKLRLIGFYRTVFDIQRRNDRTGVSFSYIKEFDKLWTN